MRPTCSVIDGNWSISWQACAWAYMSSRGPTMARLTLPYAKTSGCWLWQLAKHPLCLFDDDADGTNLSFSQTFDLELGRICCICIIISDHNLLKRCSSYVINFPWRTTLNNLTNNKSFGSHNQPIINSSSLTREWTNIAQDNNKPRPLKTHKTKTDNQSSNNWSK